MSEKSLDKKLDSLYNAMPYLIFNRPYNSLSISEIQMMHTYERDLLNPEFKPLIIHGIDRGYKVSNIGIIIDKNGREVKTYTNNGGYKTAWLRGFNKNKRNSTPVLVHRVVAEAFIPNPENKPEINHINCNQIFNWAGNLEWVTRKENMEYADMLGHRVCGELHKNSKSTDEQIHYACKLLEENKLPFKVISEMTGVSMKTLSHIRFDGGWPHISKLYNIPNEKRPNGHRYEPISLEIINIMKSGKSDKDIFSEVRGSATSNGISDKSIRDRIYHIRKNLKNIASTTIDQPSIDGQ